MKSSPFDPLHKICPDNQTSEFGIGISFQHLIVYMNSSNNLLAFDGKFSISERFSNHPPPNPKTEIIVTRHS